MVVVPDDSELNNLIAPEISGDRFHAALTWLSECEDLTSVLEIGSSAGGGSTSALVDGLSRNPNRPALYCMELSVPRFEELRRAYERYAFVKCYNVSSVPLQSFPTEQEIETFYRTTKTALNTWPVDRVLGWLRQDVAYVATSGLPQYGIQLIKAENSIGNFDMVLIDGSEFTGGAELTEVYGAKIICLDDTGTFKNYHSRSRLLSDPMYECIIDDRSLRNGFSVFCLRDRPCAWRDRQMRLTRRGRATSRPNLRSFLHAAVKRFQDHRR